jgi:integrase/recombinase XerD
VIRSPAALRDRSLLELLYAAGLRITELVDLDVADLDLDTGTLVVARSTERPRDVPVGTPALAAARAWLARGRPALQPTTAALYCNLRGSRLTRQGAWKVVSRHGETAGLNVSPNALRAAAAAHLADGGAPPGVVARLLGQAGYLRRSGDARSPLRATYDRAHPRSGNPSRTSRGGSTASPSAVRGSARTGVEP